ncbi:MAG TPA: cyclopropane-fatty-acyl-phospholipid synthase [Verrucomicrobiae bacterium]|nr:cyclopropane-fatty-acyl-phospholipid synthase [Verrucomicrobiae bacterium]
MPTITGMKGGGYYDSNSKEQRSALEAFLPWLEQAVAAMAEPTASKTSWTVLDIGSSEGGNAIYAMNRIVAALRNHSQLPIRVFFDDLPTNDFNRLFTNLSSLNGCAFPHPDVFPAAIAGSAFARLMPPRSLDIAVTFNAIPYLEQKPDSPLPNYIVPMKPGPRAPSDGVSATEAEREPFRQQSARDLQRFYTARAGELASGGKMLVQVFGRNDEYSTSNGLYDVLSDAILDLVEAGQLPRDVYQRLVFPIYFRTLDELVAPLKADKELQQAFRIEQTGSRDVPVPFNVALAATGNRAEWVRSYTGFLRAFSEPIVAAVLPANISHAGTLDRIYQRVAERLTDEPARYEFHYISVAALLTRL